MASTIKGITVKIAGDTIDLQKSLKAVQSSSASLQSELSAVNRQLKFDPENTVLLAQKQEVLKEQIENSKSALDRLLEVQNQVEEQAKTAKFRRNSTELISVKLKKPKANLTHLTNNSTRQETNLIKSPMGLKTLKISRIKLIYPRSRKKWMRLNPQLTTLNLLLAMP